MRLKSTDLVLSSIASISSMRFTVQTRDGMVDGWVTDPGKLPVFGGGKTFPRGHVPRSPTKVEIIKKAFATSKTINESIDQVHGFGEETNLYKSPGVVQVYDSTIFILIMAVVGDTSKTVETRIYPKSEKTTILNVHVNKWRNGGN
jgi:hypothetical protein